MSDVQFQRGDVVVLTGECWPTESDGETPLRGSVIVIERGLWHGHADGGLGRFVDDGGEWFVWPQPGHIFAATIIHRPYRGH